MPQVERIHPADLTTERLEVAVVIDVLRATSTAAVLLARGVSSVRIVATPQELGDLPPAPDGESYLVFSELEASRACGLACVDNSPALAGQVQLDRICPVLVTTNGTRAVAAAMACARQVLVASFVNLSSTARHLRDQAARVTLLPAGDFAGRQPRTEDERCADALEQLVLGRTPDLAALVADCETDERVRRRVSRHPDLVHDIEVCLSVDRHPVVAAVAGPAAGGVELVRLA